MKSVVKTFGFNSAHCIFYINMLSGSLFQCSLKAAFLPVMQILWKDFSFRDAYKHQFLLQDKMPFIIQAINISNQHWNQIQKVNLVWK